MEVIGDLHWKLCLIVARVKLLTRNADFARSVLSLATMSTLAEVLGGRCCRWSSGAV